MKTREGRWKQMVAIGVALALVAAFVWGQNNGLTVSRYEFTSTKVPRELDGYTIVQLSDLHNHRFGDGQRRLLKLVEELEPDLVLMTGDLVDRNRTDLIPALELAKGTSELAPTYYITGNHEWSIADRERTELLEGMTEAGVVVLEDRCAVLPVGESCLVLAGLSDESLRDGTVDWLMEDVPDGLSILLAHEPQFISDYARAGADLVFSGHAHGGQIRLPFVGGLYAPGQGFLPKLTKGLYEVEDTTLVVSRGLGNSTFPFRFLNRPEVVVLTLRTED